MWKLKLVVVALAVYGGVKLVQRIAARQPSRGDEEIVDADLVVVGISEVDPEGLMGMGEAIDPEANAAARESVRAQREKLPR